MPCALIVIEEESYPAHGARSPYLARRVSSSSEELKLKGRRWGSSVPYAACSSIILPDVLSRIPEPTES
jgi:hypothetical protein